jgi:hypothetical protein
MVGESVTRIIPGEGSNPGWINGTGLPDEFVRELMPDILRETARWTDDVKSRSSRLSLFDRHAYVAPDSPYSQFHIARRAVANDDVVSGVAEAAAGLAFQGLKWEADNFEDADIFNQIAAGLDLDNMVRLWFKEDYTYSQTVVGLWWERKTFKVRGYVVTPEPPIKSTDPETGAESYQPKIDPKTGKPAKPKRAKRRKEYTATVPVGMTFLDPHKVVPLSPDLFGRDRLAWQSNRTEVEYYKKLRNGEVFDPIMDRFFMNVLNLPQAEKDYLSNLGVDPNYLIELNPDYVFRIAPTRTPYERFADLRLKSVFPLLDMKQQLMEADRVALIGQANYILLIRIGDKDEAAKPEEIKAAREGVQNLAKVPVVVGDHRLQIDIIVPDQQWALDPERYDLIDRRIADRCLGSMVHAKEADPGVAARTIARGLEMKRHQLKRVLEEKIAKAVVDHPANKGVFDEEPNLEFMPRNVQVDSDSQIIQAVMSLRTQKELSRETVLEFFGFDQAVEAMRRQNEEEMGFDDIFGTVVPFSSPNQGGAPQSPQMNGFHGGGRPDGGGETPQSPQKQNQTRTPTGNKGRRDKQ